MEEKNEILSKLEEIKIRLKKAREREVNTVDEVNLKRQEVATLETALSCYQWRLNERE